MHSSSAWEHWLCWGWGQARCWVTNSCCSWSHCKLPTGCYCSPMEAAMCALQPAEGICSSSSSTTSKTNHISLKEQNELELWVNPFSVGWGRRYRSTPSTGRRFQTVTATAAAMASRFTYFGVVYQNFFQKVAPDKENTFKKWCVPQIKTIESFFLVQRKVKCNGLG